MTTMGIGEPMISFISPSTSVCVRPISFYKYPTLSLFSLPTSLHPPPSLSLSMSFILLTSHSSLLAASSRMWQHVKLSDVSLGTLPRYSLVVDEDVKKPNKQTSNQKHLLCTPNPTPSLSLIEVMSVSLPTPTVHLSLFFSQ